MDFTDSLADRVVVLWSVEGARLLYYYGSSRFATREYGAILSTIRDDGDF